VQKLLLLSTSLHCTNAITHHSCTRPLFAHFHTQLVFARFLHHFTAPTPSLITAAHAPCSHTFTHSSCLLAYYIASPHQRHHSSQLHTPLVRTLTRTARVCSLSTSLHCTNAITHHSCTRPLFAHFHAQLVFARFLHRFTAPTPSLITAAHAPCSHIFTHSLCLLAFYIASLHQRHHSSQLHTPLVRTLSRTACVCSLFTSLHRTNAITHRSCTRPLFAHFHAQLVFALAFYITLPRLHHHSSQQYTLHTKYSHIYAQAHTHA